MNFEIIIMSSNGINHDFWNGNTTDEVNATTTAAQGQDKKRLVAALQSRFEKIRVQITDEKVGLGEKLREKAEANPLYKTVLNSSNLEDVEEDSDFTAPDIEQGDHTSMLEAYKAAYEEKCRIEQKAISYIETLHGEVDSSRKVQDDLIAEAQIRAASIMEANYSALKQEAEKSAMMGENKVGDKFRFSMNVRKNPPPLYDLKIDSAFSLIMFLNEDLEEWFEEMDITEKPDKCHQILKIFGSETMGHRQTARRFFKQASVVAAANDKNLTMGDIYKSLVSYIYASRPDSKLEKRASKETLTNYIEKWWTIKQYCGVEPNKIGTQILNDIFKDAELLTGMDKAFEKLKEKFYVNTLMDKEIQKGDLIGYATQLDVLYPVTELLTANSCKNQIAGLVALDKAQENTLSTTLSKLTENLEQVSNQNARLESFYRKKAEPRSYNQNGRGGYRGNYNGADKYKRSQEKCYRCGRDHPSNTCRFNGTCHYCQKPGHMAQVCQKKLRDGNTGRPSNAENGNWRGASDIRKPFGKPKAQFNSIVIDLCEVSMRRNSNGDLREYISTSIGNGTPIKSLCDPGAQENGIATSTLNEYGLSDLIDEGTKSKARMADDTIVDTLGCIELECDVEGNKKKIRFAVIDKLNPAIIFGTPFLNETGVLADFRKSIDSNIRMSKN